MLTYFLPIVLKIKNGLFRILSKDTGISLHISNKESLMFSAIDLNIPLISTNSKG